MRLSQSLHVAVAAVLVSLLAFSCAGQRAPEGGPVDTDPPTILLTYPQNYTTRFDGQRIVLEFSEYVDRRTVEQSVFISPAVGALEFDWSGREVEIRFRKSLRGNTTYVVNVGTDVADLRNRNKMTQSYTLAFSTGDVIDRGVIEGKVYPMKPADSPSGVMVFAYKLAGLNPDTLNPQHTPPDYVTQTGKGGEFSLKHLSFAEYRLVAVRDEFKNLLYDPENDEFGVPSFAITVSDPDTLQRDVLMQLTKADTTGPRLIKVASPDRRHFLVDFSEPLDTAGVSPRWFNVRDTLDENQLDVLSASVLFPTRSSILLVTGAQQPDRRYRLKVESLRDAQGVAVSPLANTLTCSGSAVEDTVGPSIVSSAPPDSAVDLDLQPELQFNFSDALGRQNVQRAITLTDSGQKPVLTALRWLSDCALAIVPKETLQSKMWYRLSADLRLLLDLTGIQGRDTLQVIRFQTIDRESFSSIEGAVGDMRDSDRKGTIIVRAENLGTKKPRPYTITAGKEGAFALRDIVEGQYVLSAFRDRDGNGKYDAGSLVPFTNSERFVYYPDTLKVRARWPLEGVRILLR